MQNWPIRLIFSSLQDLEDVPFTICAKFCIDRLSDLGVTYRMSSEILRAYRTYKQYGCNHIDTCLHTAMELTYKCLAVYSSPISSFACCAANTVKRTTEKETRVESTLTSKLVLQSHIAQKIYSGSSLITRFTPDYYHCS